MRRRQLLIALAFGLAALSLGAPLSSSSAIHGVPRLIFPVVGPVTYTNDFGDPRAGGGHQGNDLMAAKKSLAVAAEAGTVKFWTSSANAGCMLYLHGASGTVYQYIHLNNDVTMKNDNRGRCVPGMSYAKGLRNGAHVVAGQPIGYVGDSGDANGIASHLHFEVHPHGRATVSPYPYLKRARVLLFAADPKVGVSLTLGGTLVKVDSVAGTLEMQLSELETSTGLHFKDLARDLVLSLSPDTLVVDKSGNNAATDVLGSLSPGTPIEIATTSAPVTLAAELGSAGALATFSVTLSG